MLLWICDDTELRTVDTMWMLNVWTMQLRYFKKPEDVESYAILSHVWDDEEQSFRRRASGGPTWAAQAFLHLQIFRGSSRLFIPQLNTLDNIAVLPKIQTAKLVSSRQTLSFSSAGA